MERATLSRIAHRHHPIAAPGVAGAGPRPAVTALASAERRRRSTSAAVRVLARAARLQAGPHRRRRGHRPPAGRRPRPQRSDHLGRGGRRPVRGRAGRHRICIGASHAFGGLAPTLSAVRRHLRPGGQVLLGDALWERPPSAAAQEALQAGPDEFPTSPDCSPDPRRRLRAGHGHVSTLGEWDDYEWSWTGSLTEWALREAPSQAERAEALAVAQQHRDEWLLGYRGRTRLRVRRPQRRPAGRGSRLTTRRSRTAKKIGIRTCTGCSQA